jgi:hypothetical protein
MADTAASTQPASRPTEPAGPSLATVLHIGPFHVALRTAVQERGMSLDRVRAHLAQRGITVSMSLLNDWQKGYRKPAVGTALRTVMALEEILGLRPRSLIRLLVEPRSRHNRPRGGIDERSGVIADLLDALPGSRAHTLDVVSTHEKITINAERRVASIWSRTTVRARQNGVDRRIIRYYGDPNCAIDQVEVQALGNCYIGAVRRNDGVLVAELRFGEPLKAGETWVLETQINDGTGQVSTQHLHGFQEPGQRYQVEIQFDPEVLPVDTYRFTQSDLPEAPEWTGPLALDTDNVLRLREATMSAGLVGIGWSWP